MNHMEKKHDKKIWVTPEIKIITQFDVHENVVATSLIDTGGGREFNQTSIPEGD